MKQITVAGQEFTSPRYVARVQDGWQTRTPGQPTLFFGDAKHGGVEKSHEAAVAHRIAELPLSAEDEAGGLAHGGHVNQERSNKENPTGIPGVYHVTKPSGTQVLEVRVKGTPMRTVHINGSLPAALETARQVREEQLRLKV